jgi:hypothetical protein
MNTGQELQDWEHQVNKEGIIGRLLIQNKLLSENILSINC